MYPAYNHLDGLNAKANYTSFGSYLRLFLLNPQMIPSTTCPEAELQLLSLCQHDDGFLILQQLKHLLSLRRKISGLSHRDHGTQDSSRRTYSSLYSRTIKLSLEISLAQLQDGSYVTLHE